MGLFSDFGKYLFGVPLAADSKEKEVKLLTDVIDKINDSGYSESMKLAIYNQFLDYYDDFMVSIKKKLLDEYCDDITASVIQKEIFYAKVKSQMKGISIEEISKYKIEYLDVLEKCVSKYIDKLISDDLKDRQNLIIYLNLRLLVSDNYKLFPNTVSNYIELQETYNFVVVERAKIDSNIRNIQIKSDRILKSDEYRSDLANKEYIEGYHSRGRR